MGVDTSELRHLQADLAAAPGKVRAEAPGAVGKTLESIASTARIFAPVDDGDLVASIGVDVDHGGLGGDVGPTVDYGDEVEYGAAPHTIRAHGTGALAFPGSGGLVFAEEVHHPGNPPQPYMGPAFDARAGDLDDELGDIGEGVL